MQSVYDTRKFMTAAKQNFEAVIVGLGQTGLSCLRFLASAGLRLAVMDSRVEPPELATAHREFPQVPIITGGFDADVLKRARDIVVSPGVSLREPALVTAAKAGAAIVGDIELFSRHARAPVVAVTGSNGKSTVATLVNDMIAQAGLRPALGGNVGTPALDLLSSDAPDYYVLELSSFQLESVSSLRAVAAGILNISPDHMDRYGSVHEYALAKERVYRGDGAMIVNLDDALVSEVDRRQRRVFGFTLKRPRSGEFGLLREGDEDWLALGDQTLLAVSEMKLRGRHNYANMLAALAFGTAIGLPLHAMCETARKFQGLPHRCQWVARTGDVDWYDDSKGTNVGASCAAVVGLEASGDLILIAGGDGKGQDFTPLAEAVRGRVRSAVLLGRDAPILAAALRGKTEICFAKDMRSAVSAAARVASPGDAVLLSPACASFDMFRDYRERGEVFVQAIRDLESK